MGTWAKTGGSWPSARYSAICFGRVRDVVVAADHVGDRHGDVVAHDRQVVDRGVVAPQDDEVVEVASLEADPAVHRVVPGDLVVLQQEADGGRHARASTRVSTSSAESR